MFVKIINFLIRNGGSEMSIANQLDITQPRLHRIKCGQMPRWDVGQALIALEAEALKAKKNKK